MGRVEHDLSDEQWIALKEAWGGCAYCGVAGKPLQRDCVLAIAWRTIYPGQHRAGVRFLQYQQVQ
jgi:hypothetical protein